jgi:hypothetical protein
MIPTKYVSSILRRSAREQILFGYWLVRYQLACGLFSEEEVAQKLGINMRQMATLAMCRPPRREPAGQWSKDIQQVAQCVDMAAEDIGKLLKISGYAKG